MKTRRGFLGRLLGLVAAPWVAKALPADAITFRGVPVIPDTLPVPEVFHGSFKIGEITRRVARSRRLQAAFDRTWDHQKGLLREYYDGDLWDKRILETTKELEAALPPDVSRGTLAAQGFLPEPWKE